MTQGGGALRRNPRDMDVVLAHGAVGGDGTLIYYRQPATAGAIANPRDGGDRSVGFTTGTFLAGTKAIAAGENHSLA